MYIKYTKCYSFVSTCIIIIPRGPGAGAGLYRKITINPASIINKKTPPPIRPPSICQSVLSADLLGVDSEPVI